MSASTRSAPHITNSRFGFVVGSLALVVVFAASSTPIPLYEGYRQQHGLSVADLSLTTVAYFGAVMTSLLTLSRLSDHLGRRVVGVAALAVGAAGCLILLGAHQAATLAAGRALQGVACGLAITGVASYVIDTAPPQPRWIAATTVASAPLVGLTVGALGAGAFVQYGPMPDQFVYLGAIFALAASAGLMLASPETVDRKAGVWKSLLPRLSVPPSVRPLLPAAAAVYVSTWALGGFYQAFSPTLAADHLHTDNAVVHAVLFASFMAPTALGGLLIGRFAPASAQRTGIIVFAAAVVAVVVGLQAGSIATVLVAGALAGVGQGAAVTGSIRALMAETAQAQRAGVLAVVYLISYSGAAAPNFVAGRLSLRYDLAQIAIGYAVLAIVACLVTVAVSGRSQSA